MKFFLKILLVIMFGIAPLMVFCGETDTVYSVKHRWVLKSSVSPTPNAMLRLIPPVLVGDYEGISNQKGLNFRVEADYAPCQYVEVGLSTGFLYYQYAHEILSTESTGYSLILNAFAPLFGLNVNVQLLPIFIKAPTCRWDLYLTANYSGCFAIHREYDFLLIPTKLYRQVYGLGLGLGYYFKNIIGIYGEFAVGNYSYFPDYLEHNVNFKIGICAKF